MHFYLSYVVNLVNAYICHDNHSVNKDLLFQAKICERSVSLSAFLTTWAFSRRHSSITFFFQAAGLNTYIPNDVQETETRKMSRDFFKRYYRTPGRSVDSVFFGPKSNLCKNNNWHSQKIYVYIF